MRLGIVRRARGLHDYVAEMLRTWGIASLRMLDAPELGSASPRDVPVVVLPAGDANPADDEAFLEYARRGGTGLCFLPGPSLAAGLGLDTMGEKAWPLRFRATGCVVPGLAGESIPIAARAQTWGETDSDVLGFLCHPGQYSGETPGVVAVPSGRGRIVAFAFDLAECVQILRQGDPSRAERVPPEDGCARPSHIAAELGQHDAGWVPFADLLACFLADLARASCPFPLPRFSHLPGQAASILLYSGDEDHASPAATAEEMHAVQAAGGSMSLYLIPTATESTPDDVRRYRQHHAVGPHPNLRPLDGHPVAERLAELERQIRMFTSMFGVSPRTVRNHCTAWAGHLEPIEVLAKLGVRMEGSFFSSAYMRSRDPSPYGSFGAAMPMRFCRVDGQLIDVFQQHTHLSDDVAFGSADYSYKLSPQVFSGVLRRIFTDITTRFHTPYGVCIHPSNWEKFSRAQGQELLRQGRQYGLPISGPSTSGPSSGTPAIPGVSAS